jgi:hypothetical protein
MKNSEQKLQLTMPRVTSSVLFSRVWEMPNKNTFDIKCVNKLIHKYLKTEPEYISVDPFANKNRIATFTNDLDPEMKCDCCMDALDFLQTLPFLKNEIFQITDFYSSVSNPNLYPIYHHFILFSNPTHRKDMKGFCTFIEHEKEIYIMVIGIHHSLSHLGNGSKMIEWIKYKNRKNKKRIRAQVSTFNIHSISFFQKNGFIF